ncbi:MAG: K(+)-transporting ATPase subunit F [Myxococcota bacterium]
MVMAWIAGGVAVALVAYLFLALLFPEDL